MKKVLAMLLISSLFLVACGSKKAEAPEKDRFISAMSEAICATFESGDLSDEAGKAIAFEAFKKHGFEVDDDAAMMALKAKYEEDADVDAAMEKAFTDCAPQEILDALNALGGDAAAVTGE